MLMIVKRRAWFCGLLLAGCTDGTEPNPNTTPVEPENLAPIVAAVPTIEAIPGTLVTLAAQASDADGSIATTAWTQTTGPEVTLGGADTLVATFTAPAPATDTVLEFDLQVTDDDGDSADATVTVTVLANAAPMLTVSGPPSVDPGETVTLLASVVDDFGPVAGVTWTQTAGDPVTLTPDGSSVSFEAPVTRYGEELAFQATATDALGAEAMASLPVHARGSIDTDIEEMLDDVVLVDFETMAPSSFLFTDEPGDGVFKWRRTDTSAPRNITAPVARFLGLAGYLEVAALGLDDMALRTGADPVDPANFSSADLGTFLFGYDLLADKDYLTVAEGMYDTAVTKYVFDDTFPRGIENYPQYPGLWGYDAQNVLHGWFMADQHALKGSAAPLADQAAWYEARYAARVAKVPENAIFTNLIADWYGIGARTKVTLDVEDLGFQYTAFALMGNTVDADVAAEYLLEHLHDDDLVSEEVAEGVYALSLYLQR